MLHRLVEVLAVLARFADAHANDDLDHARDGVRIVPLELGLELGDDLFTVLGEQPGHFEIRSVTKDIDGTIPRFGFPLGGRPGRLGAAHGAKRRAARLAKAFLPAPLLQAETDANPPVARATVEHDL
jgi:hypothetical protein